MAMQAHTKPLVSVLDHEHFPPLYVSGKKVSPQDKKRNNGRITSYATSHYIKLCE